MHSSKMLRNGMWACDCMFPFLGLFKTVQTERFLSLRPLGQVPWETSRSATPNLPLGLITDQPRPAMSEVPDIEIKATSDQGKLRLSDSGIGCLGFQLRPSGRDQRLTHVHHSAFPSKVSQFITCPWNTRISCYIWRNTLHSWPFSLLTTFPRF